MHTYLKNNPAKFHPDPIWNDGALVFLEDGHPNKINKKVSKIYVFSSSSKNWNRTLYPKSVYWSIQKLWPKSVDSKHAMAVYKYAA